MVVAMAPYAKSSTSSRRPTRRACSPTASRTSSTRTGGARGHRQLRQRASAAPPGDAGDERAVHAGEGARAAVVLRVGRHRHRRLPRTAPDNKSSRPAGRRRARTSSASAARRSTAGRRRRRAHGIVIGTNAMRLALAAAAPANRSTSPPTRWASTPDDGARDEPDVSALAGPPYITSSSGRIGGDRSVGGTSAATPIWAGVWALLEQAKSHVRRSPTALESSTRSARPRRPRRLQRRHHGEQRRPGRHGPGGYAAAAGYDLATGWGTPNVPQLIANWQ